MNEISDNMRIYSIIQIGISCKPIKNFKHSEINISKEVYYTINIKIIKAQIDVRPR